jgi:excinuclease ABC subunit A
MRPARTARGSGCGPRRGRADLRGKNICEATALTITEAKEFFDSLTADAAQMEIAGKILEEVRQRLNFLHAGGAGVPDAGPAELDAERGRVAADSTGDQLGSRLVGALYVLDEPSIGLHTRDTAKLIRIMEELRDLGNTILVVEHDPDVIRAADHLLDLGPGAGELAEAAGGGDGGGGEANPNSLTGRYLSGREDSGAEASRSRGARSWC